MVNLSRIIKWSVIGSVLAALPYSLQVIISYFITSSSASADYLTGIALISIFLGIIIFAIQCIVYLIIGFFGQSGKDELIEVCIIGGFSGLLTSVLMALANLISGIYSGIFSYRQDVLAFLGVYLALALGFNLIIMFVVGMFSTLVGHLVKHYLFVKK
ncbi:MAG: hypothetical protein ACP5N9_03375 [Candidatus Bilamarchaeum sp.]|jgi:hypothetical protein